MKVAFRVDASTPIGSGHLMRCLTLAQALEAQGAHCHFISRAHAGHLIELTRQRGFAVTALPAQPSTEQFTQPANSKAINNCSAKPIHAAWLGCNWQADAQQTRAAVESLQTNWLVVDHYAIDTRWEAALRPHCKKLMVIDDLADRAHECDVLLDQNLGRKLQDYASLLPAGCKALIGPAYALLRPEFAALRAYSLQRRRQPSLKNILITMGGADQFNATSQVLQALKGCALSQSCHITVVMGPQALWLPQVRAQAQGMPCPTDVLVNIDDMAQRMAGSDLAISAAGSTSWERCCLGLPALMVVLADNQKEVADCLERSGAAYCLSLGSLLNQQLQLLTQQLLNQPEELNRMTINSARITDGLGTERVALAMHACANKSI